ncbi:GNAT family N-acetyltransferase [Tenuibacillus multivorans]|uniref:Ribosomal-protein-serine acetyltransferase n=1 Tax=Tenuibacillus multivorans TaxID=237069 RepID=A0A1G9X1N9_9BACI|nr:GNAT family protein [Tenuibacillus multivorans]GEL77266.1 ribosomal-protein-serine acetyltransferase [Tenuibacillus multivorans]SDM90597.1 ribosomal-protein-serine acetyltransferase [Tenuibacillus multivorans]
MFVHTIDEELSLRLIDNGDAEEIFQLTDNSRDHLRVWLSWVDGTKEVSDTKGFIDFSKKLYANSTGMTAVILYHGDIAGLISFNKLDWQNKIAHIGYWLAQEFTGKGIMTRAARAMTDYAFSGLNMHKAEIRAAENNAGSRAVPKRLGFVEEGRIRSAEWLYDRYVDHIVYGMLNDEWGK